MTDLARTIWDIAIWSGNNELAIWGIGWCVAFLFGFIISRWRVVWGIITGMIVLIWMIVTSRYWSLGCFALMVHITCVFLYFRFYKSSKPKGKSPMVSSKEVESKDD